MLHALAVIAAAAAAGPPPPPSFDGYALGMTVEDAEAVIPRRRSFECGKLMTSRCIVYGLRLGSVAVTVTVQFAFDTRRIDRIEIAPQRNGQSGGSSCAASWHGLVDGLTGIYGQPQLREGNTVRWEHDSTRLTATVLQEEDEFCDVTASLTAAQNP